MASFTDDGPAEHLPAFSGLARARRDWFERLAQVELRYVAALAVAVPLVALAFARFGATGRFAVASVVVVVLCVLSAIDITERRLPNRIVLPTFALVLAAQFILAPDRALEWTVAAGGAALLLLLPLVVLRDGVGMGDVKLALLLGAALGAGVMAALVIASFAAAAYAVLLIVRNGAAARQAAMPLGPFLALGAIFALFL